MFTAYFTNVRIMRLTHFREASASDLLPVPKSDAQKSRPPSVLVADQTV
jgi:hypothetical protein